MPLITTTRHAGMATALEAYPRVQVVVESVGRGLYNCWRRHMADSDPALLPPPVLRSPGPLQSPLLCICCTRIKDSAVPRGPSVTMDGPMVFCSRGEGLDSPFSCLPLPPATCNLEAQGLDFYYQVLFWLTGSVIIEYESLRYWMRRPKIQEVKQQLLLMFGESENWMGVKHVIISSVIEDPGVILPGSSYKAVTCC